MEAEPGRFSISAGNATGTSKASGVGIGLGPLRDDHPCYALVGRIAAETARIERLLDQAIADLTGMDLALAACISGQMIGAGPRYAAIYQLVRHRGLGADLLERSKLLGDYSVTIFERRNRAVHDPWLEDTWTGESYQYRGKSRRKPEFGGVPITTKNLEADLAAIQKHQSDVSAFVGDIWKAMQPS